MMKVYATNEKIDPGINPFVGQQLIVDETISVAVIPEPEKVIEEP